MSRPLYESPDNREAEEAIAHAIKLTWKCMVKKLPIRYEIDFALVREEVVALAEIKRRYHRFGEYETYMISLGKVAKANSLTLPCFVVVGWNDCIKWASLTNETPSKIEWGGRTDRKDWQDEEPCAHYPIEIFKPLMEVK